MLKSSLKSQSQISITFYATPQPTYIISIYLIINKLQTL